MFCIYSLAYICSIEIKEMELTEKQLIVLKYLFENTPIIIFNKAVKEYNIQRIYTRLENSVSVEFFDNDKLRASVFVADLFNQFQTQAQEIKSKEINSEMKKIEDSIKFKAKFKRNYYTELGKFNELRDEHRLLNEGFNEFRKIYKKYKNKK